MVIGVCILEVFNIIAFVTDKYNLRVFMNKKFSLIFALGMLLAAVPAQAITHYTAAGLAALSLPASYIALRLGIARVLRDENYSDAHNSMVNSASIRLGSVLGSPISTATTYWTLYQFTPSGRYNRASKKVQNLKDEFPRVFGDVSTNNIEQILHDLGAFTKTYKSNRNFVYLNVLQELDKATKQLKKAESLLIAAKKDICPEPFEWCVVKMQRLYAKADASINKLPVVQIDDPKNHIELSVKIDALLVEVQTMLNKVTSFYSLIELHGSAEFKQQLKDYEELSLVRSQKTRSAVINFAIPSATIVGSLAALTLAAGKTYAWVKHRWYAAHPLDGRL